MELEVSLPCSQEPGIDPNVSQMIPINVMRLYILYCYDMFRYYS
jgi:hypothetical protein